MDLRHVQLLARDRGVPLVEVARPGLLGCRPDQAGRRGGVTTLVAVDLDQTLIYSARSIRRAGGTSEGLVCVELLDGVQQSFMTSGALAGVWSS